MATDVFKSVNQNQVNLNYAIPEIQFIKATADGFSTLYFSDELSASYDAITLLDTSSGSISLGVGVAEQELERALGLNETSRAASEPKPRAQDASPAAAHPVAHSEAAVHGGASAPQKGLSVYSPRVCFAVGGFFVVLFCALYLLSFGLDAHRLVCVALMRIDPACPDQSSDIAILRATLHPFSYHTLPLILFWAAILLTRGVMEAMNRQSLDIKAKFKAAIVLRGFFSGFSIAKCIVFLITVAGIGLVGYLYNFMSFA